MINDCMSTPEQFGKDPDIVRFYGFTQSTSQISYYFSKKKAREHIEDLKDIYTDLPRQPKAVNAPFGYVFYHDLITMSDNPKRRMFEFQLADCFTIISEISELSFAQQLHKNGRLNGACSMLATCILTRSQINARKKKSDPPSSDA